MRRLRWLLTVLIGLVSAGPAGAADWSPPACLAPIARQWQVHPAVLKAVVLVESSGNPLALNVNVKGKGRPKKAVTAAEAGQAIRRLWQEGRNFDIGLGQINIRTAVRYGVHPLWLLDPCWNLYVTAWHLREKFAQHGYNWTAIERYNGINPRYPWKVYDALARADVRSGASARSSAWRP